MTKPLRRTAIRSGRGLWVVLGLIIAAVFAVDLLLPLGVAAGVPYIVPVLLSRRSPARRVTLVVAIICTLLTVAGYFMSLPSGIHWMVLANRGLAIGAIWACAFLLLERKRVGEALRETGVRLRAIFETTPDGIIVIAENGRIESVNVGATKLFGYRGEELVGQNVAVLMPSPHAERHDAYLARYRATGEKRIIGHGREVVGKKKDGTQFPFYLAVGEIDVGGRRSFTGVLHDLTERRSIEKDSLEDPLTGLANRRAFDRLLSAALSRGTTSLLFIDVDRLKAINDSFGHVCGDEALAMTADRIRTGLRSTEAGISARIGGDEFAVILPNTERATAQRIGERLFEAIHPALTEIDARSGVSIGVASASRGALPSELLRRADQALYRAKKRRGRVSA